MSIFGAENEVVAQGAAYMQIMLGGWLAMEFLLMSLYIIQSSGDTFNPMKVEFTIRFIHLTLCPFLVLGLWIFPALGIQGVAVSNIISQVVGASLGIWLLFSGHTRLKLQLSDLRPKPELIIRMLKIGIPALVMNLQRSFGNLALTWLLIPFGTLAVAAHSIITRIEMFLYLPSMAVGSGAGVLVGQNLGARQPQRAEKGGWLAAGVVECFVFVCSAAILIFAENIMSWFSPDAAMIELGAIFLRIATAGYLLMALTTVFQYCISGAGDTLPNMIISIGMIWVIQFPVAILLSQHTGLDVFGVRWAIVAANVVGAAAYLIYFKTGRWKMKRV
jgi:putative MATE family efflux protein